MTNSLVYRPLMLVLLGTLGVPCEAAERQAPGVVAHRGLLRHSPENTLASFRACLELRLGFEVDVRRSKDGHLVCVHDDTVDRTTNGTGAVSDLTLKQLQTLDAGSWFDLKFRGERIPSLHEILGLVARHKATCGVIAIDLKAPDVERDLVELAKAADVLDHLLFIGRAIDNVSVRERLRLADPATHVARVAHNHDEFTVALRDERADWVYFRYLPTADEIRRLRRAGKQSFIAGATVSGSMPDNWRRATRAGIDAILTDYPLALAQQLREGANQARNGDTTVAELFHNLSQRFIDQTPSLSPVSATALGDHRFDDKLDDVSEAARSRQRKLYRALLGDLVQIDRDQLSRAGQVDYQLLEHDLRHRLWNLERLQEWAWNPVLYTRLTGGSIYKLMARDFAPIDQRLEHAAARLEQFPRLHAQIRETLQPKRVPKVHAETAIKQNRGVLSILRNMVEPRLGELPDQPRQRLSKAIATATSAINEHQRWLESELLPEARGDFRLGKELYDEKLAFTLHSNLTRQQIHDRAASELTRVRREMYSIARQLLEKREPNRDLPANPSNEQQQLTIQAALDLAAADIPGRNEIVATAKQSVEVATAFVRDKDLVTLPPDPLDIILMPEFQRGVSFAYCDSPGPLDVGQKTFYAVAPLPTGWTDKQSRSFLREYNIRSVHNLTIHEAMPGHFLQLAHANRYSGQLRAVLASGVFIEGWANYAELMMCDEGFLDDDPLMRLVMLKWYLRSIANALLDQAIHVDGLQRDAAMKLMTVETFQEEREAAAKWTRAQLTSTQLSTYFVGFQEHRDMRSAAEKEWGKDFTLKRYHDRALSFGSPPVRFVRALLLDQPIPK